MENLYLAVIPAQAGIHWHQELRDSRFRGSDDDYCFPTASRGEKELEKGRTIVHA